MFHHNHSCMFPVSHTKRNDFANNAEQTKTMGTSQSV